MNKKKKRLKLEYKIVCYEKKINELKNKLKELDTAYYKEGVDFEIGDNE